VHQIAKVSCSKFKLSGAIPAETKATDEQTDFSTNQPFARQNGQKMAKSKHSIVNEYMHFCKATIQDYKKKSKILSFS
jgi:hypothetical protein